MDIIVKTAHYVRKTVWVQLLVHRGLLVDGRCKPSLMRLACDALYEDAGYWYKNKNETLVHENVFDAIYPLCSKEDWAVLRRSLLMGSSSREFRSEVALRIEPYMKVGALKFLLKLQPWIPPKNLMLVQQGGSNPLEDDSATLADCGIMGGDSVLACMGGSFLVTVRDVDRELEDMVIPISSCFEMVGDLKKKICQKIGKDPDELLLSHNDSPISKMDNITLVAHGIVRQYWSMEEGSNVIDMICDRDFVTELDKRSGGTYAITIR